jgi:hypothetical protein
VIEVPTWAWQKKLPEVTTYLAGPRRLGRAASTISESCGATPQPEAAASSIVRRQRKGTPSALLAAQSRRSLRATRR